MTAAETVAFVIEGAFLTEFARSRVIEGRGEIAVIRNAGPDYVYAAQEAIEQGGALITEAGGSMAHLVTVFRDQNLRIVRVPDARKLYPAGRSATVDCDKGQVRLADVGPMRLSNGVIISESGVTLEVDDPYKDGEA